MDETNRLAQPTFINFNADTWHVKDSTRQGQTLCGRNISRVIHLEREVIPVDGRACGSCRRVFDKILDQVRSELDRLEEWHAAIFD